MSISCGIRIELNCKFIEKNIFFILYEASNLNIIYLKNLTDKQDINCYYLNIDHAVIELQTVTEEVLDNGGPCLHVKFKDTDFFLWTYKTEKNQIVLYCGTFGFRWNKQFDRGCKIYTIDFSRYIRLWLNILKKFTLLIMATNSDLIENIQYVNQKCITALISMGTFREPFSGSLEGVKGSFIGLIENGFENKFIFFNATTKEPIKPSVDECYESFIADFPVYLHAKKNDIAFKFEIKRDAQQGFDFISIYPLEPCLMKKGYGSEEEKIDVTFYIERLLELCENFAIYELQTFL